MDNYQLKVVTLFQHELKEAFQKVPDPDRLTTSCTQGDISKPETYETADVVFLSYTQATTYMTEILEKKAPYTHLILLNDGVTEIAVEYLSYDFWDPKSLGLLHHISALKEKMLCYLDLELKNNQLYTLIDSVPDLIWYKDLQGAHIDINDAFCHSVDQTRKEIKYRNQGEIMGLTPEEFANGDFACVTTDNLVIKEQDTALFDEKVLIHHEMRQFKTYKTALKGRQGESIGTVGVAHDVTDIWNTHEEFRIVISRLPFPMIILDKNYELLSFNSKFEDIFGYNSENQDSFEITAFGKKHFNYDIALRELGNTTIEKQMTLKGETQYFIIEKSEITDVFGELSGYFYVLRDVTETRKYEEKLRIMADTDELTQINNRKALHEFYENKLDVLAREKISFGVAMIDIDFFKLYNDHYGHLDGDMVIKTLASILKSHSDNENIFVARFGGEEFLVLTIGKTKEEFAALIGELQTDLKQAQVPHEKSKVSQILTMSIGGYYIEELQADSSLPKLIEIADKYLYQAKEQGRNRFISNL